MGCLNKQHLMLIDFYSNNSLQYIQNTVNTEHARHQAPDPTRVFTRKSSNINSHVRSSEDFVGHSLPHQQVRARGAPWPKRSEQTTHLISVHSDTTSTSDEMRNAAEDRRGWRTFVTDCKPTLFAADWWWWYILSIFMIHFPPNFRCFKIERYNYDLFCRRPFVGQSMLETSYYYKYLHHVSCP